VPVECEASVIWTGQAKAECFSIIKLLHTLFIVFTPSTVALAIVSDRHFNCIFTPYKAARAVFACPQHVRTDTCCFRGCLPASCACLLCFQKIFFRLFTANFGILFTCLNCSIQCMRYGASNPSGRELQVRGPAAACDWCTRTKTMHELATDGE
jgi:hypothetical protein